VHFAGGTISANWAALKATLAAKPKALMSRKRKAPLEDGLEPAAKRPERVADTEGLTSVLAVDCEMVGVGFEGKRSSLARYTLPRLALPDVQLCKASQWTKQRQ
jgi:RNA exonuclease 4